MPLFVILKSIIFTTPLAEASSIHPSIIAGGCEKED
jgi:hypothetical protein